MLCFVLSSINYRIGIKSNLFPLAKWMENLKVEKTIKGKTNNLIPKQGYSSPGRIKLWEKALIEFKNRSFIGIGMNVFAKVKAQEVEKGCHTHDLFLNILVELGVVGFCISLWLGYLILKRINFKDPLWAVPIILILAGQMVDFFFHDFTFTSVSLYLLAVSLVSHE